MKLNKLASISTLIILSLIPIAFCPGVNNSFVQGKELFLRLSALVLILIITFSVSQKQKVLINKFWRSKTFAIIAILAFITLVSGIISEASLVSVFGTLERGLGLITYSYVLFLFILFSLFLDKKQIRLILKGIFIVSSFIGLYAVFQKLGFDPLFGHFATDIFESRSFAFIGNPTLLGQYLAMSFFVGFIFEPRDKKYNMLARLGQTVILFGLIATEARAGMLALFIGLAIYLFKFRDRIKLKKIIAYGLVVIGLVAVLALSTSSRFGLESIATRSIQSRIQIWSSAYSLIKEKPLIGYGPETFYIHFPSKVNKTFFELEEDLNSYADRVHNEFLAIVFSIGIIGGVLYLILIFRIIQILIKTDERFIFLTALITLVNFIQNQLGFIDLNILVLLAFLFSILVVHESETKEVNASSNSQFAHISSISVIILCVLTLSYATLIPQARANWYYSQSKVLRKHSYDFGVLSLKESINHMPFYADPWFDLLQIDPSSSRRALTHINKIEGRSPNYLAWMANTNRSNLSIAEPYYKELLGLNPLNPHWVRAYADALYINNEYEKAYELYKEYLNLVPIYWQWKDQIDEMPEYDQKRYRVFFKNNPDFWTTLDKIEEIEVLIQ